MYRPAAGLPIAWGRRWEQGFVPKRKKEDLGRSFPRPSGTTGIAGQGHRGRERELGNCKGQPPRFRHTSPSVVGSPSTADEARTTDGRPRTASDIVRHTAYHRREARGHASLLAHFPSHMRSGCRGGHQVSSTPVTASMRSRPPTRSSWGLRARVPWLYGSQARTGLGYTMLNAGVSTFQSGPARVYRQIGPALSMRRATSS